MGLSSGRAQTSLCRCRELCLPSGSLLASLNTQPRAWVGIPLIFTRLAGCTIRGSSCSPTPLSGWQTPLCILYPSPKWCLGSHFPIKCWLLRLCLRLCFVRNLGWAVLLSVKFKFSDCFPPWLLSGRKAESKKSSKIGIGGSGFRKSENSQIECKLCVCCIFFFLREVHCIQQIIKVNDQ